MFRVGLGFLNDPLVMLLQIITAENRLIIFTSCLQMATHSGPGSAQRLITQRFSAICLQFLQNLDLFCDLFKTEQVPFIYIFVIIVLFLLYYTYIIYI